MGKAVAFSFALASNAMAAEPEEERSLSPVIVPGSGQPLRAAAGFIGANRCRCQDLPQSITIIPQKLLEERAAGV
jgi:hypothetical protein